MWETATTGKENYWVYNILHDVDVGATVDWLDGWLLCVVDGKMGNST